MMTLPRSVPAVLGIIAVLGAPSIAQADNHKHDGAAGSKAFHSGSAGLRAHRASGPLFPITPALAGLARCTGKSVEIPFDGLGGAIELPIHEEVGTIVHLPGNQISKIAQIPNPHIKVVRTAKQLAISPRAGAPLGMRASIKLIGYNRQHLAIYPIVVDDPSLSPDTVRLVPRSEIDAREALVHANVEMRVRQAFTKRDLEDRRRRAQETAEAPFQLAEQLLSIERLRSVETLSSGSAPEIVAEPIQFTITQVIRHQQEDRSIRHVRFVIRNQSTEAEQLDELHIEGPTARSIAADIVAISTPNNGIMRFPVELGPGQTVTGIVRIPDDVDVPNDGLTISISGPNLFVPLTATAYHLTPEKAIEDEFARIRREYEEQKERERLRKEREARGVQTIVSAVAHGSLYFVGDGVEGTNDSAITTSWAVGGKVVKGIAEPLAGGIEIVGGRIAAATIEDVEWDDMIGDVERSASFARVGIGIDVRLGDITIPYLSLGVGVQIIGYNSTFTTADAVVDGPGDGLDAAGYFTGMFGIDYRVGGEDLLIGANASYMTISGGERAFGLGARFGVAM